jgi:hypothetical protein
MAFATVSHDEYGPHLLLLLREQGGWFPGSLYGYRILSVSRRAVLLSAPCAVATHAVVDLRVAITSLRRRMRS